MDTKKTQVLVLGSGGREHTFAFALSSSNLVAGVHSYPGNGGMQMLGHCPKLSGGLLDFAGLESYVRKHDIGLIVVGPELPLVEGAVDHFENEGLTIFGPNKAAARLEGSKVWAKGFMARHQIPTADFKVFENQVSAFQYAMGAKRSLVVKADGLCGGKGVYICQDFHEASQAIRLLMVDQIFGQAGSRVVIEEVLSGQELSFFVMVDKATVIPFGTAVDYKRAFDGNQGLNTGGMGVYSPFPQEQLYADRIMKEIVLPTVRGLKEEGIIYRGFLYFGLMLTPEGPQLLEYNVRMGDPEAQVVIPRLNLDLYQLMFASATDQLNVFPAESLNQMWKSGVAVGVVATSKDYPGKSNTSTYAEITGPVGIGGMVDGSRIFQGATVREGDKVFAKDGRVFTSVGFADTYQQAARHAYGRISQVRFADMRYRSDIAAHVVG